MAIQLRRGAYANFDPAKMTPGEPAIVVSGDPNSSDGKSAYVAFAAGDVKRLATHDDIVNEIESTTEEIAEDLSRQFAEDVQDIVNQAQSYANQASSASSAASESAGSAATKAQEAAESAEEAAETVATIIDDTLTQTGKAADAKATGDAISDLNSALSDIEDEVINVSGSWTKKYAHNFTPSDQVLLSVESSTSDRLVAFSGIADMDDEGTITHIFTLAPGKKMLWVPDKDYEGIQVAVNGSCVASATILGVLTSITNVFYCGASRELKTIKAAVEKATEQMDSILYVDAGTYDLINEFGSDYFESLTSNDTMSGIKLKNRIHVVFAPNSKVICHYTGNNQYAQSLFSPFVVDRFGFTLENLTLECSRVRYAVHDERNGGTEYCESNYINCNMSIDNAQNQYFGSNTPTVIGGGLGTNHVVNIESCIFDSNKEESVSAGVYYHQSNKLANPNHKCLLSIKNNYFKRGLLIFQFERTDATEDTNIIVEGNNFPMVTGQDSQGLWTSGMTGNHVNLFSWNNVIRRT